MVMKQKGKARSIPAGVLMGVGVALGWTILASAVAAKLIDMEWIGQNTIGYASLLILLSGSFLAASVAKHEIKKQRLMVCGITAAGYYLSLLAITALFFGGQYQGMGVTALLVLCGSALAALPDKAGRGGNRRSGYQKAALKIVQTDHR